MRIPASFERLLNGILVLLDGNAEVLRAVENQDRRFQFHQCRSGIKGQETPEVRIQLAEILKAATGSDGLYLLFAQLRFAEFHCDIGYDVADFLHGYLFILFLFQYPTW